MVKGKQIARVWHQFEGFKLLAPSIQNAQNIFVLTQVFIEFFSLSGRTKSVKI